MFYEGEGTKVDYNEAFGWFGKAAEQGHADAMFQMANMLAQGHGFPQSIYASLYWLQKSAAAGNETAAEFFPSMCSTMAAKAYFPPMRSSCPCSLPSWETPRPNVFAESCI